MVRKSRESELTRAVAATLGVLLVAFLPTSTLFGDNNASPPEGGSRLSPEEQALVATVPYSSSPVLNRTGTFDERYAVSKNLKWRDVYKKPRLITLSIDPVPGGSGRESSIGDVEGVFPIEPAYFFEALIDYSSYPRVSPRTVYSIDRSTLSGPFVYHKRVQKVSAQFLGFGQTYLFVTNNYEAELGKDEYGLKWNLEKSLDGKFYTLMGSWYVKGMVCDGLPCSYVRYFNHTGFNDPPPVPISILGLVTGSSFKNLPLQFYRAAVRLKEAQTQSLHTTDPNGFLTLR